MQPRSSFRSTPSRPPASKKRWIIASIVALAVIVVIYIVLYRPVMLLVAGERIDIGGRTIFVLCKGSGSPTILLEHGLGADGTEWKTVQDALVEDTRVCFTSRAGMGFSDPVEHNGPRTVADAVDDLETVLAKAEIGGPYLLVGHSFGGYVIRLLADRYPDQVIGIVLVDSSHPARESLLRERLSQGTWDEVAAFFSSDNPEQMDLESSSAEVEATGDLGDLPLVILQAGHQQTDARSAGISQEAADELDSIMNQLWPNLQRDLTILSTNSRYVLVEDSGHFIHVDRPQVVIDAIRSILEFQDGT